MTKAQLRKQVHQYIDLVDEDFLHLLNRLLHDHLAASENSIQLSAADISEIEKRKLALHNGSDKGFDAGSSVASLRSLLKKKHK